MQVATPIRLLAPRIRPREDPGAFVEEALDFIRLNVKPDEKVKVMVSGGTDSLLTAVLFNFVIGDRLYVTHSDTNFMRLIRGKKESEIVAAKLSSYFKNFKLRDDRELFFGKIRGVQDAETKRRIFRDLYTKISEEEMELDGCSVLTQGTIFPDIVETDTGIKAQSNVQMPTVKKIVEPIACLYKDEVRKATKYLAEEHGIRFLEEFVARQPFPGPGLSVRVVGSITPVNLNLEREANDIFEQRVEEYTKSLYGVPLHIDPITGEQIPFQWFTAVIKKDAIAPSGDVGIAIRKYCGEKKFREKILSEKATAIKKGSRDYSSPLCLQCYDLDYDTLTRMGMELPNNFDISRVLYHVANGNKFSDYSVTMRCVRSIDANKASVFELPMALIRNIGEEIAEKCRVAEVFYDFSGKPPATIEYE